jgi:hypothetical protein
MKFGVELLCDCIGEIDGAMKAGRFGKPGDLLHDELDSLVTLLAFVRDRLDCPADLSGPCDAEPRRCIRNGPIN